MAGFEVAGTDDNNKKPNRFLNEKTLRGVFNFVASAGLGMAVGYSAKAALLATTGSAVAAVIGTALAVGAFRAAWVRCADMRAWNAANENNRVSLTRDFFNFEKTGHTGRHYFNKGGVSALFSLAGGAFGIWLADYLNDTVQAPANVEPQAGAPVVHTPEPVAPVHIPTPEELLQQRADDLLAQVKANLPAHPDARLSDALHRLESTNVRVRAQAIKDLGYFFANGFDGVKENDALADKLFQLSIDVSGGKNIQAMHDLGYQMLWGKGTAVDYAQAYELLSKAKAGGHPLSGEILDYMKAHHLPPAAAAPKP